jgi:hypothetical protein
MCCCGKPTVNGEMGYRWNDLNAKPTVRPLDPPTLNENEALIYDEPGRCGGLDSHCHHYRLVRHYGSVYLLVRHGGGDERMRLSSTPTLLDTLATLDSNARYWIFNAMYHAHSHGARDARSREQERWRTAALDKRIRVRRRQGTVHVSIEPKIEPSVG